MIRDNASTSTRIDWRRRGTITSSKLRETRFGHLGSHLGVRVSWRLCGETNREPALSEWREEEEGGRGAASRIQTSALSRDAPSLVARR